MDLWKRNGTLNGLCPRCFGSFKHLQIRFLTSANFNNNLLSSFWLTCWLYQVNSQCDGDRDSYDAMILLTGRFDYHDVRPGLKIFFKTTSAEKLDIIRKVTLRKKKLYFQLLFIKCIWICIFLVCLRCIFVPIWGWEALELILLEFCLRSWDILTDRGSRPT